MFVCVCARACVCVCVCVVLTVALRNRDLPEQRGRDLLPDRLELLAVAAPARPVRLSNGGCGTQGPTGATAQAMRRCDDQHYDIAHAHARAHARTHERTHARTHARTHTHKRGAAKQWQSNRLAACRTPCAAAASRTRKSAPAVRAARARRCRVALPCIGARRTRRMPSGPLRRRQAPWRVELDGGRARRRQRSLEVAVEHLRRRPAAQRLCACVCACVHACAIQLCECVRVCE